jgi:5-bromo-4-chloroindolyl phosphate hydrolysis protein
MGKLLGVLMMVIISVVIVLIKIILGKVTGNADFKNVTIKGETKKVMDKTAKGINWMEQQWEESKKNISENLKK